MSSNNSINLTSSSESDYCELKNEKSDLTTSSILLTSDSDESVNTLNPSKRRKYKKETVLGKIDLITSDEDEKPKKITTKRKATKRAERPTKKPKKIRTIDLLTSDEDEDQTNSEVPTNKQNDGQEKLTKTKKTKEGTVKPAIKRKLTEKATTSKKVKPNPAKPNLKEQEKGIDTASLKFATISPTWHENELLANRTAISPEIAQSIINLFEAGNTIPFIARYRRNVTNNMTPEALRDVKESYEEICSLKSKIVTVINTIQKAGKLDNQLQQSIRSTRTLEELEHIYAPFKPEGKRSLAEKAKELGLEEPARHILENVMMVNLDNYINPKTKGLSTREEVKEGVVHIIASLISTDTELLTFLRELRSITRFIVETKKCKTVEKTKNEPSKSKNGKLVDESKFEIYYDFKIPLKFIKPHQVLAINRGEAQKCLRVKIDIPQFLENRFKDFCYNRWIKKSQYDDQRKEILFEAVKDAYTRQIQPLISREIRAELKMKAEKASVEIFIKNLKQLLMATPLKGKPILGIDPGFKNGCKVALISATGLLLAHCVVYPHNKNSNRGEDEIRSILKAHRCELIALGNGTACRETETWISELINSKFFAPLNVKYTIVSEDGASIYSCSPEAKKEFKDLDPNIISTVSIARRVQEPMAELVKVEPAHLGIGMYQLDLKKKQLNDALDEVVSECVSFVGVDLNTASQCLLRKVAGLSDKRATQIIDHREKIGTFCSRKELLKVFGIGKRIYEQCAGFLRVGPATPEQASSFYKKKDVTKLDATIIHPESYEVARRLIKKCSLKESDIGTDSFINVFKAHVTRLNIDELSTQLDSSVDTIQLLVEALTKKLDYDLRGELGSEPLFKEGLTDMNCVKENSVLTGRVTNVTTFGAFVDIGVGSHGLVHISKYNGLELKIGDKIEVKVYKIKTGKNGKRQLQLEALRLL